jgi:hypothetical protein
VLVDSCMAAPEPVTSIISIHFPWSSPRGTCQGSTSRAPARGRTVSGDSSAEVAEEACWKQKGGGRLWERDTVKCCQVLLSAIT